jgi:hypothetical protein
VEVSEGRIIFQLPEEESPLIVLHRELLGAVVNVEEKPVLQINGGMHGQRDIVYHTSRRRV